MDKHELQEILEQHQLWLDGNGGKRADLRNADLHNADLREANLRDADLSGAILCNANLRLADLRGACLHKANLCWAYLHGAKLSSADLSNANLNCAHLCNANLSDANLYNTNLLNVNLIGADLYSAKLYNVEYNCHTNFFALQCPEEGSFIGYKKAGKYIVKLEILADAKRSSATTRKCRCSAAKVLSITTLDGRDDGTQFVSSDRDSDFVYQVGEIVRVDDFDENRWNECSTGIHFFITRDEAVEYWAS